MTSAELRALKHLAEAVGWHLAGGNTLPGPLLIAHRAVVEARVEAKEKRKPLKRKTKKRDASVYDEAKQRAAGRCEQCGRWCFVPQFDHFFGRARAHSTQTVWALCEVCHYGKTSNVPDARTWLGAFITHCEKHGYTDAAEMARRRLEGIVTVREASR